MYLDQVPRVHEEVGYGGVGLSGDLGYDGLRINVSGHSCQHAISAHAPSRLVFDLDRRFESFRCRVAVNDDALGQPAKVDFLVIADGRLVAVVPRVVPGEGAREVVADVRDADRLELMTQTSHWAYSHAVWLDPELQERTALPMSRTTTDCLARVEITPPRLVPRARHCIATVVSPGYADLLDDLLGSIAANGDCRDALIVVFMIDADERCQRVIEKHHALPVACRSLVRRNATVKSVLYSVATVIDAEKYLCLDADTLVLEPVQPLFDALDAYGPCSILVSRDAYLGDGVLREHLEQHYRGTPDDIGRLLRNVDGEADYPLAINDGVFVAGRRTLLAIDSSIRAMPDVVGWVDQYADHGWRNQFIFNLMLAKLRCGVTLDPTWNMQVHVNDVELSELDGRVRARWSGRPVRILHFCGWGRDKYPALRGRFALGATA